MRIDGRQADQLRPIRITPDFLKPAEGSALIEVGDTKVICTATIENRVPMHKKDSGTGWLTAEYAMLPRSAPQRIQRDGMLGRVASRSTEIQRLIGRAMRAVFDLDGFGERTIIIDCDVLQADGGTRTAAISGGFVALALAIRKLEEANQVKRGLIRDFLAAVSVGMVEGRPALDLNYLEDSQAEVDMNVVMLGSGRLVEIQGTAEAEPFSREQLHALLDLAAGGVNQIVQAQKEVLGVEAFAVK